MTTSPQPSLSEGRASTQARESSSCLVCSSTKPVNSHEVAHAEPRRPPRPAAAPTSRRPRPPPAGPGWSTRSSAAAASTCSTRLCGTSRPSTRIAGVGTRAGSRTGRSQPLWTTVTSSPRTPRATSSSRVASETATYAAAAVEPRREPRLDPPADPRADRAVDDGPLLAVDVVDEDDDGRAGRPGGRKGMPFCTSTTTSNGRSDGSAAGGQACGVDAELAAAADEADAVHDLVAGGVGRGRRTGW